MAKIFRRQPNSEPDLSLKNGLTAITNVDPENETSEIIGGFNAVTAALKERPRTCRRILLAEGRHGGPQLDKIFSLAREHGLSVKKSPRAILDKHYGRSNHQGVLAFFDAREYAVFEDLLKTLPAEGPCLVLALDKVEDPRNLGALMRTAAAFKADGIIVPRENSAALTPAALSAAAGAAEFLPLCRVVNLIRALEFLKQAGFWLVGAEGDGGESAPFFVFPPRTVLILGSEGQGLSRLVKKNCDFLVGIPHDSTRISSLNVSVAGGILIYEYFRQLGKSDRF